MGRKHKQRTKEEAIKRFLERGERQELAGQTKLKHYHETLGVHTHCKCCEKEARLHRHRIIPGSRNGLYTPENVYWCCALCHKLIHKIYDETSANNKFTYELAIMIAEGIARREMR
jgi:hypothetical protein